MSSPSSQSRPTTRASVRVAVHVLVLALALASAGCGLVAYERLDEAGTALDSGPRDAGPATDGSLDASADAATDAGSDAGFDAGFDAGTDGGMGIATCTLTASADGTTDDYVGASADGTATTLYTADDGASFHRAFFRFDVASATCAEGGTIPTTATILDARIDLRLVQSCGACTNRPHDLRRVTTTWTEATLPAGAGPSVSASASASFTATSAPTTITISGGTLVVDVQSMLDSPASDFGFRIAQTSGTSNNATPFGWASREAALNRPTLVITYQ